MKKANVIPLLLLFICSIFISYTEFFYFPDRFLMDTLYQVPSKTDPDIRIIAIDEQTLDAYGPLNTWSREKSAQLVNILNQSEETMPCAIALDIMFIGETNAAADESLASACQKSDNIITAVNIVYDTVLEPDAKGNLKENKLHIAMVETPYSSLLEHVRLGFANTNQDDDSYIRRAFAYREYESQRINSLSVETYQLYCEKMGLPFSLPGLDRFQRFSFSYSGKPGGYEVISLLDILEGNIDPRIFKDSVVFVGAYAPGLMDSFYTPIDRSRQMYGVEIHANIFEALLEGKTLTAFPPLLLALLVGFITVFFYILVRKLKVFTGGLCLFLIIITEIVMGKVLYQNGIEMPLITLPILIVGIYTFQLVKQYLEEKAKRQQVVNAFKKYVAPQVVEEISKSGNFQLKLGGENRNIACLFVDIRGFTPMSESLEPEQVVEILNEYLSLTTNSIFKNSGTLDKFIGDATMAVFNAPFDLDDYIYKAVCAARDIAAGSQALEKNLMERFGKSVSFGIGVNCGPAVVGNIGCDFRMDYTAIGDTVNTAARLESNAKRGQILISDAVYQALQGRITAEEVGVIPLKGKSNGIMVYSLTEVH